MNSIINQNHDVRVAQSQACEQTVLIVDDSKLQRKILSSTLTKHGYKVVEAESGEQALLLLQSSSPDIVISDWMMPGMSGLDLCRECRGDLVGRYIYFILLTSKNEQSEIALGLDSGADDFLSKPVGSHELLARISAGVRILDMQRQLTEKNRVIGETLAELQQVYNSLDNDLMQAKELQQSLVPEKYKQFENSQLSLLLRSCGHVGGDLVGFFQCTPAHLGLYAIDVSGHGVSSALMTARLAGYLSNTAIDQNIAVETNADGESRLMAPSDAIGILNRLVLNEMETEHYFTLMLVDIDLETGFVRVGQAGHPRPIVQRKSGEIIHFGDGGFPVGLIDKPTVCDFEIQLEKGDRLFVMSDGVSEATNESRQMLEEDGLSQILERLKDVSVQALPEAVLWELSAFVGSQGFHDDVSIIAFEYQ